MSFFYIDPWQLREEIKVERRTTIDLAQVERRLKKFARQREETPLPTGLPPISLVREQVLDLNSQLLSSEAADR